MIMDRFGSSESGAQGAVEEGATGPRFVMGGDTSVLDDELRPLRPGDGRIGRLARTGRIPVGYYKDKDKTEATFPVDAHGVRWSIPGDLASVEPDGTITVHGRGSASINSGGEKIFPEEVEAAVKTHPGIFDAIVVGLPDERFGERVAVIDPAPQPEDAPDLEDIQAHCRELHRRLQDPPPAAGGGRDPAHRGGEAGHQGGQGALLSRGQLRTRSADRPSTGSATERRASTTRPTVETTRSAAAIKMSASIVHRAVEARIGPQAEHTGGHGSGWANEAPADQGEEGELLGPRGPRSASGHRDQGHRSMEPARLLRVSSIAGRIPVGAPGPIDRQRDPQFGAALDPHRPRRRDSSIGRPHRRPGEGGERPPVERRPQ